MPELVFTNWDGRPAVLVRTVGAWAVLLRGWRSDVKVGDVDWRDGGRIWDPYWTEVDYLDVFHTAYVMPESDWRSMFGRAVHGAGGLAALPINEKSV